MTKNLQSLSRQLREFDIHESKSCCSAGHETQSGERIPCDQDLIYQSLADWYGHDADDLQGRLKSFNTAVRTQFADRILATCDLRRAIHAHKNVHPHCLQHEHSILDHYDPDAIGQAQEQQSALLACVVALRVLLASWGHVWPSMLVYLWACKTMWTLTLQCNQWLILIEAGAPVFVLLSWAIVGGVCVLPVLLTHRHSWPPRVVFVAAMALGLYLLWVFTLPVKACRKNTVDKTSTECGEGAHQG